MAKKSKINKNMKTNSLVSSSYLKRIQMKKDAISGDIISLLKLNKPSRSVVRKKLICQGHGRPRGFMGDFGMSRLLVREMASKMMLPGVKKV